MSIIYKALQKAQDNLVNQNNPAPKILERRSRLMDIILLGVIGLLSITVCIAYFPKMKTHLSLLSFSKPAPKPQVPVVIPEMDYQNSDLLLSGVFVSSQDRIAVINNQQYHVGDMIKNMKIISIDQSQVKLLNDNVIFVMHVS